MGRSIKKGPYVDAKLLRKVMRQKDTRITFRERAYQDVGEGLHHSPGICLPYV